MNTNYLSEQFNQLITTVSQLNQYKSQAHTVYMAQDKAIRDFHENLPDWSLNKDESWTHYFHYQSPSTGEDLPACATSLTLKDELELNSLQQLKTYHWLLAEAYEAFEDFLENAYAHCGREGIKLWIKPKEWKHKGSRQLKDFKTARSPYGQLEAFRVGSEHFRKYEIDGPTGKNYKVSFVLLEKLRHIIIHNAGYCDDFQPMIDKMQGKLDGIDIRMVREYTELHFMSHRGRRLLDLFDAPYEDENGPTGMYQDILLGFFRTVVEYAQLIVESINIHKNLE